MQYSLQLSKILNISQRSIENTLSLLDEGATIPFIARYRKERTGNLDEVQIASISKEFQKLVELEKRREFILKSIESQGKLTPTLAKSIQEATLLSELEDLYLPYKPKKRSKSQVAIAHGLEPLAKWLMRQEHGDTRLYAQKFLNDTITTIEDALQGAREIIAEWIAEDVTVRNYIRDTFTKHAVLHSKKKRTTKEGEDVYKDYFEYKERLSKCPAHRYLACIRGEKEGFLNVQILIDRDLALGRIEQKYVRGHSDATEIVLDATEIAFDDHLQPQFESEFRALAKEKADKDSIHIFGKNLKQLLLQAPLGQKCILGIDPGFKTGCKIVVINKTGDLIHHDTIYPHPPIHQSVDAENKILHLVHQYQVEAIAIGNGTAGRETEDFVKKLSFGSMKPLIIMVNESGASIYSASEEGREEFPHHDITVRGAVSIARRLMDPLAELVKIDAKSIGVGQYQHDVNQTMLKEELDTIVVSAVNYVGVELNTASKWLLQYVSGVGPQIAKNILEYRNTHGIFKSRDELKKVPRLGAKVFEQAAGFLRIHNSTNPLDNTAIHPERYALVEKMAQSIQTNTLELISNNKLHTSIQLESFKSAEIGMETLNDIIKELSKPGRDPRDAFETVEFDETIRKIDDLKTGQILNGIVTNITKFGAFVNIGVKQDGLVHISAMSDSFISDPNEVISLNQMVKVQVIEIDIPRHRIQLSMKLSK